MRDEGGKNKPGAVKAQEKAEGDAKVKEAVDEIRRSPGSPRDSGPPPEPDPERAEEAITDESRASPLVNDSSFTDETDTDRDRPS